MEAVPPGAGGVAFNAYAGCPPVLGAIPLRAESRCDQFLAKFLQPQTARRTTPLVLISRWHVYLENPAYRFTGGAAKAAPAEFIANLVRSSCALAAGGPTYVMLPTPEFPFEVTHEMQRRLARDPNAADITMPLEAHLARNRELIAGLQAARACGVRLLDPAPYVCPNGVCEGSRDHRPLYRDSQHMSEFGARLLVPMFRQVFGAK